MIHHHVILGDGEWAVLEVLQDHGKAAATTSLRIRNVETGERRSISFESVLDGNTIFRRYVRGPSTDDGLWTLAAYDRHSGILRFQWPEQGAVEREVSPERLSWPIEARLRGREREGTFVVSREANDRLRAFRADAPPPEGTEFLVRPFDVVGDFMPEYPSSSFGQVPVKVTQLRWSQAMTGSGRPVDDITTEWMGALSASGIGVLPQTEEVEFGKGDVLLSKMAERVRDTTEGPLVISIHRFRDTRRSANQEPHHPHEWLADLLSEHARNGNSVSVATTRGHLQAGPDDAPGAPKSLRARLEAAGLHVTEPSTPWSAGNAVVHHKSISHPDWAKLFTGEFGDEEYGRIEMLVTLSPRLADLYYRHEAMSLTPGSNSDTRRRLLGDLAREGVVLNDHHRTMYTSLALNGMIRGARSSIRGFVKHLLDVEVAEILIEQARQGVEVDLKVRGILPAIEQMIEEAKATQRHLPLSIEAVGRRAAGPMPHFSAIIADEAVACITTAYLWDNQLATFHPSRSSELGVIISDPERLGALKRCLADAFPSNPPARS
ncbi:MAG TPA: hypothetical protein VEY30_02255 [Myxococcaceae bacterium]|nr:hypothetical protein [Myxococcaceae bacterium]